MCLSPSRRYNPLRVFPGTNCIVSSIIKNIHSYYTYMFLNLVFILNWVALLASLFTDLSSSFIKLKVNNLFSMFRNVHVQISYIYCFGYKSNRTVRLLFFPIFCYKFIRWNFISAWWRWGIVVFLQRYGSIPYGRSTCKFRDQVIVCNIWCRANIWYTMENKTDFCHCCQVWVAHTQR